MNTDPARPGAPRRRPVILFGGSFDPPQLAHRFLIEAARRAHPEAEIVVIPAGRPPHKLDRHLSDDDQRLELCRIAFADLPEVRVSDEELHATEPNYTWKTLERHRAKLGPDVPLYWLLGSDSLLDLPHWRAPDRILHLARILTVPRPGFDVARLDTLPGLTAAQKQELREGILPEEAPPIAATRIRRALAAGEDCSDELDPRVLAAIRQQGMYETAR